MKNQTNNKKPLADPNQYSSSWAWTRAHSEYHFNNNIQDQYGDWFEILGTFQGDWSTERDNLIAGSRPVTWASRKYYDLIKRISPMLTQEEYDIQQAGVDPTTLELTNIVDDWEEYPTLYKMMDYFGLEVLGPELGMKKRAHIQLTGQMFNYHIDKLWDRCPEDPERVCRITIMLDDWQPGQFYMYGNYLYSKWKAGEAHIFDWASVPHATANASNSPRVTLQVTGLKTNRTREILATASKDRVFTL